MERAYKKIDNPGNLIINHTLPGKVFSRLTVLDEYEIRLSQSTNMRYIYWKCRCECGIEKFIQKGCIILKKTISCGCVRKDPRPNRRKKKNSERSIKSSPLELWVKLPNK